MQTNVKYPRINELNIIIQKRKNLKFIDINDIKNELKRNNLSYEVFNELFGSQTGIIIDGIPCLYPYDIEAVLERMLSGKITGTQLFMD